MSKEKCSECNRSGTYMEWTGKEWVYWCGRHRPPSVTIRQDTYNQMKAVIDAVEAYLTAKPGFQSSMEGDMRQLVEEAFFNLVEAFKVYRPEVEVIEKG